MPDHHVEVEQRFVVESDAAQKKLSSLERAASGVSGKFDAASRTLAHFGGVAGLAVGAFSVERLFEATTEKFAAVKQLSEVTGLATERASGLLEVFEKAGVELGDAQRWLMQMSVRGARLSEATSGMAGHAALLRAQMKALGVDIRQGPELALQQMAKATKDGKLDAVKLVQVFGMRQQQAAELLRLLKRGPEEIKETLKEVQESGTALTKQQVAQYAEMKRAQRAVGQAWEEISVTLGKEMFPLVRDLMQGVQHRLEGSLGTVQQIGTGLREGFIPALAAAETLGKVMMANFLVAKLTGKTLTTWAFAKSAAETPAALSGLAAIAALNAKKAEEAKKAAQLASSRVPTFQGAANSLSNAAKTAGKVLGVMAGVALAGEMAWVAKGLADSFTEWLIRRREGSDDKGADAHLGTGSAEVSKREREGFARVEEILAAKVGKGQSREKAYADLFRNRAASGIMPGIVSEYGRQHGLGPWATSKVEFNFPGATFNITQKFAEGFDPDRIAVAFANDIADLGEHRLMSNLSQLSAIR